MRRTLATTTMAIGMTGLLALSQPAQAGLLPAFSTDAALTSQITTDGLVLQGSENFESSTLAASTSTAISDPLSPGVAKGPFPTGSNVALGMTVQSNTLGGNPTVPSPNPPASNGLAIFAAGALGAPSSQVTTNSPEQNDSLDLIFGSGIKAVKLTALFASVSSTSATSHPGTIEWEVFGPGNVSLGTGSLANVDYSQDASDFLGFVTSGSDTIYRINLFAPSTAVLNFAGVDDISGYRAGDIVEPPPPGVPEPASLALLGTALFGLAAARRRRG